MASTTTLTHPSLSSTLTGTLHPTLPVASFRNLKFASIPRRFSPPVPVTSYPPNLDCTQFGPVCPQEPGDLDAFLFAFPPEQRDVGRKLKMDEFDCLNLVVNVPLGVTRGELKNLPVLVSIHGGANRSGSSAWQVLDTQNLVAKSVALGKPIIAVSMNYRLALLGFSCLPNETANLGLLDQRAALAWIKSHIRGFGGDPSRVTLTGESAGAFGVDAHLHCQNSSQHNYFTRAILQSGAVMSSRPMPRKKTETMCKAYGDALPGPGSWDEKLKKCSIKELIGVMQKLGSGIWPPTEDGGVDGVFPAPFQPYQGGVPEWCDAILVGDCEYEAFLWIGQIAPLSAGEIRGIFGKLPKQLAEAYGLTDSSTDEEARRVAMEFVTDGLFTYPAHRTLQTWSANKTKKVYSFSLDQHNPWTPEYRRAHHAVDLLFLYGNFSYPDTPAGRDGEKIQDAVQTDFLSFVYGEENGRLVDYRDGEKTRVYGFPKSGDVGFAKRSEVRRGGRVGEVLAGLGDGEVYKCVGAVLRYSAEMSMKKAGQPTDGLVTPGFSINGWE